MKRSYTATNESSLVALERTAEKWIPRPPHAIIYAGDTFSGNLDDADKILVHTNSLGPAQILAMLETKKLLVSSSKADVANMRFTYEGWLLPRAFYEEVVADFHRMGFTVRRSLFVI